MHKAKGVVAAPTKKKEMYLLVDFQIKAERRRELYSDCCDIMGTDIFIRNLPVGSVPIMFSFVSVIFITSENSPCVSTIIAAHKAM